MDIGELDFILTHDLDKLSKDSARDLSLHDVNLLKIILTSGTIAFLSNLRPTAQAYFTFVGLYPNIAVVDELNHVRKDSDQLFHTRYVQAWVLMKCIRTKLMPIWIET